MGYVEDVAARSVAPPGWTSTPAARPPAPPLSPTAIAVAPDRADAAVRWRISAAIIDNLIVYAIYAAICLVLHWRVAAIDHLWLVVVLDVIYHFVLEARDGQTIGKRQYGIRVVAAGGGDATMRAIAVRSLLRIVDQLPTLYLSGLVSMLRTGRARRQRIGDVAGQTMVVAVDGYSTRGTPGWVLPTATVLALLISALGVFGLTQAGSRQLTGTQRAQFIAGCEHSASGQVINCACLLDHLEAAGYNTPDALREFADEGRAEALSGRLGAATRASIAAVNACRN